MANETKEQKPQPTPPKKGANPAVFVRMKKSTIDWLEGQTDEDEPTVPGVVRRIIEEKRRGTTPRDND